MRLDWIQEYSSKCSEVTTATTSMCNLNFPLPLTYQPPTQHLPKQLHKLYLIPVIKHPAPLSTTTPHNDTTPKLTQTPDHTTPSHTAPISNSFPTTRTLYTHTLIAFTPHSSALHNTTRYTYLLLQDRQL